VKHIDFTEPYTDELRNKLLARRKPAARLPSTARYYAATQGRG